VLGIEIENQSIGRQADLLFKPRRDFFRPARGVLPQACAAEVHTFAAVLPPFTFERVRVRPFKRDAIFPQ
jgi:hypothetical protein